MNMKPSVGVPFKVYVPFKLVGRSFTTDVPFKLVGRPFTTDVLFKSVSRSFDSVGVPSESVSALFK